LNIFEKLVFAISMLLAIFFLAEIFYPCIRFWVAHCDELDNRLNVFNVVYSVCFGLMIYIISMKRKGF